jgi:uncharacterized protein DUF4160
VVNALICQGSVGENNEPMHVHARKGDAECKFWIYAERFEIDEVSEFNLTPRLRREIRQVLFEHFDEICSAWKECFEIDADQD